MKAGNTPLITAVCLVVSAIVVGTAQNAPPAAPAAAGGQPAAAATGYTSQQAERGRVAYESNCSGCHGLNLNDGPSDAPPLTGVNFQAFWGTRPVRDLFSHIMTSMPPTTPGSLGEETTLDVVAYIVQRSGVAAGTTPLVETSTTALNNVGRSGGRGGRGGGAAAGGDDAAGGGGGASAPQAFGAGNTAGPGHGGAVDLRGVTVHGEVKNYVP